jgi:hypothetical protein
MLQALRVAIRSVVSVRVASIAVLLAAAPAIVCAQQRPSTPDYINAQPRLPAVDGAKIAQEVNDYFWFWVFLPVAATVVVGVLVVLKVTGSIAARAGTADLEAMARNDPWIREQLAKKKAAENDPSPPPAASP